nr:leishmanolysin family protein [Haemonchus contortus]
MPRCYNKRGWHSSSKLFDTDFVLFVSVLASDCVESALAYSRHCVTDEITKRPVAGFMNICPHLLKEITLARLDAWEGTLKHELIHTLSFSMSLFPYFPGAGEPQW